MNFEAVTFKLTKEYVDVMGGTGSKHFAKFKKLMVKGFLALREHAEEIISFVEMTMISGLDLPCFQGSDRVLEALRERFRLDLSPTECRTFISDMVDQSTDSLRTRLYDWYQRRSVGIW
jgi:phosphatidylinositol 4-kinase